MINEQNMDNADEAALAGAFENYHSNKGKMPQVTIPENNDNEYYSNLESKLSRETDPDLVVGSEVIKLPSKGLFYKNGLSELEIEYLTSKDEDIMTTPSLIESGKLIDVLLERKIKTKGVNHKQLLSGDKSAIILFLRASSYGHEYKVTVTDPRTRAPFEEIVDLRKFKYKELKEIPDENGCFSVKIPKRNKLIKFTILTSGEEEIIEKQAEAKKTAYKQEFSEYQSLKLKAAIVSIDDKSDRDYISRFVDAMPALDSYTIRKKILEVTPEIDMDYEFTARDGYKFTATLYAGPDFFFPNT